jgi:hypothetical protein
MERDEPLNIIRVTSYGSSLWPSPSNAEWVSCFCVVNFDLEYGQKLETMVPKLDFHDKEISNLCFLSFPETSVDVGDTIYTFRLRRYVEPSPNAKKKKKLENQYLFGFVLFRQQKDPSISRGYLQKSVVLVSPYPHISLFKKVVSIVGPVYFEKGEIALEASLRNISAWPPLSKNKTLDLPFMGHILTFSGNNSRLPRSAAPENSIDIGPNSMHLSLYSTFSPIINKLWTLWELVLLCEPIIVVSNSPQRSSDTVLALVSLIYPLNYSGDYRPYFTIHDPDYAVLSDILRPPIDGQEKNEKSAQVERSYIIGVTNPIFKKEFDHWPHMLILDDETVKVSSIRKASKNTTNVLISKYKPLRTIDDEVSKQLIKKNPGSTGTAAINNELVRRCMDDVTAHFMAPLQDYYPASYLPKKKDYNPFKNPPTLPPFKEAEFLKYLLKLGTKTKDIELYRRFIRTPNFVVWFRAKKKLGEQEIIKHYIASMENKRLNSVLANKGEVEVLDLWMRAQDRKKAMVKKGEITPELTTKFDKFIDTVFNYLPEDVKKSAKSSPGKTTIPIAQPTPPPTTNHSNDITKTNSEDQNITKQTEETEPRNDDI